MTKAFFYLPLLCSSFISAHAASSEAQQAASAARELAGAIRNCDMSWIVDRMYPPVKLYYANKLALRSDNERQRSTNVMLGGARETQAQADARHQANIRALRSQYIKQGQQLKSKGIIIERFTVDAPHAEYIVSPANNVATGVLKDQGAKRQADQLEEGSERSRLVVLPTTLILRAPLPSGQTVRVEQKSFIYAVRDEVTAKNRTALDAKPNTWYFVDAKTPVGVLRSFFPDLPAQISLPPTSERQL